MAAASFHAVVATQVSRSVAASGSSATLKQRRHGFVKQQRVQPVRALFGFSHDDKLLPLALEAIVLEDFLGWPDEAFAEDNVGVPQILQPPSADVPQMLQPPSADVPQVLQPPTPDVPQAPAEAPIEVPPVEFPPALNILFTVAAVGLVFVTIGGIYLAVTDFLERQKNEAVSKEAEAKAKAKAKSKKKDEPVSTRPGPKGFGQKRRDDIL